MRKILDYQFFDCRINQNVQIQYSIDYLISLKRNQGQSILVMTFSVTSFDLWALEVCF